jgi:hypothetical protein
VIERPATTTVAVRCEPGLTAIVKLTPPVPVRDVGVTVIHVGMSVTDQVQPDVVTTANVPVEPVAGAFTLVGVTEKLHAAPFWVTVNVCPAIVIVPVRGVVKLFAVTVTVTVPLPVPAVGLRASHSALGVVVQVHVLPVVTVTSKVSPVATAVLVAGEIEYVHDVVPGCITVNSCPPMVTVPVRCAVPVPLEPSVSQDALLVEVQAHDAPVVSVTVTVSPAVGDVRIAGVSA